MRFKRLIPLLLVLGSAASAQSPDELTLLRSLQPEPARLQPVEAASLTLLGRGITFKGGQDSLALACVALDLPQLRLPSGECNAFRVVYFKGPSAYLLSLPVAGDPDTDAASLPVAASRLFQKFIPLIADDGPAGLTGASFDQRGWNWGSEPIRIPEADFLRAVLGIAQSLEPLRLRAAHRSVILPSVNRRLWADEAQIERMMLFL